MKIRLFITASIILVTSSISYAGDDEQKGKELLKTMCAKCHALEGKPTIAPPIIAVKRHVINAYQSEEAFVERIVDWVEQPDAAIALMPGAIKKFGLMPKLPYDNDDVKKIAKYLYHADISQPKWFKNHFEERHGKK